MEKYAVLFKKFSLPAIFLIVGLSIIYVAVTQNQSIQFKISGVLITLGAVFSFLNISGKSNPMTNWAIGGLSILLAIYATFATFSSVKETLTHQENYRRSKLISERNLQDLRTIQKAYNKKYGTYAIDWDELFNFAKSDSIWEDFDKGSVPSRRITLDELKYLSSIKFTILKDGEPYTYKRTQAIDNKMTEDEAIALCKMDPLPKDLVGFVRDSVAKKFIETTFTSNKSYMKERDDNDLGPFSIENLKIIPLSDGTEWKFETKKSFDADSNMVVQIKIGGLLPYAEYEGGEKEEIYFSNFKDGSSLKGTWEDEK